MILKTKFKNRFWSRTKFNSKRLRAGFDQKQSLIRTGLDQEQSLRAGFDQKQSLRTGFN